MNIWKIINHAYQTVAFNIYFTFKKWITWKMNRIRWYISTSNKWLMKIWNKNHFISIITKTRIGIEEWGTFIMWNNNLINYWSHYHVTKWHKIEIWNTCKISRNVSMFTSHHHNKDYWLEDKSWDIIIWDNVWIWCNSVIMPWISIWNNVIIWAWSIVTKNISSNTVNAWVPCRFIKDIIINESS